MVDKRAARYKWLIFALLSMAYLVVIFHRLAPAVVAVDMMQDLNAGPALMGLLASAYFYPYALMQFPVGLLADSWGPRRTITAFFVVASAGSLLLGMGSTITEAMIGRLLVGMGVAPVMVHTMKIFTRWFRLQDFTFAMGIFMAVGGVGALSASAPFAYLSNALSWRWCFVAIGLFGLVVTAGIWMFVRNRPEEMGFEPPEVMVSAGHTIGSNISLWRGIKTVIKSWRFWPLAIWFFFSSGVSFTFAGLWGGPYLMHVYGLTKPEAGQVLAMIAVGMVLGSPFLSYASGHLVTSRKAMLTWSSWIALILYSILAFLPGGLSIPFLYLICFLLGIFGTAIVIIAFTLAKELFPLAIAGTATGLMNLFPFVGGASMQIVSGIVLQSYEGVQANYSADAYGQGFLLFVGANAIALLATLLIKETSSPMQRTAPGGFHRTGTE
ncbi:MAG: MFS transporter [Desulfomonile tiedjei]|uniref:Lysosomal dipeptide transporter MFSD1 n=1 Tax=Desulfomonile tiedjei TaxID=2358 RepID=A0A9D6V8M5_9BACT|nr:MFS transporter [Desulfomonile tiedjei]